MEVIILGIALAFFGGTMFVKELTILVKTLHRKKILALPSGNKKIEVSIATTETPKN